LRQVQAEDSATAGEKSGVEATFLIGDQPALVDGLWSVVEGHG
jgi:hypothetical protein